MYDGGVGSMIATDGAGGHPIASDPGHKHIHAKETWEVSIANKARGGAPQ